MSNLPRLTRLAVPVVAVVLATGCTGGGAVPGPPTPTAGSVPDGTASPGPTAGSPPGGTPSPDPTPRPRPLDAAAALVAAVQDPLDPSVLPPGYDYVDRVEVDDGTDAVSNIYGGPEGPTGPTIWLYTGIRPDYTSDRQAGVTWQDELGLTDRYTVRSAQADDHWVLVDVDAHDGVGASIQLVGKDVPRAELRAVAVRLIEAAEAGG